MDKAKQAIDVIADGVKKMTANEKKPKVKKEKGGDGGADNTVSCVSKLDTAQLNQDSLWK